MSDFWDSEYNAPNKETEYRMPKETSDAPIELTEADEDVRAFEYSEEAPAQAEQEKQEKRGRRADFERKQKIKLALQTLLTVVAATSVLTASLGIDLLGKDVLGESEDYFIWEAIMGEENPDKDPWGKDDPRGSDDPSAGETGSVRSFPKLENLDPDFNGEYAWADQSPDTSEEYLRMVTSDNDATFLEAGGYYRNQGVVENNLPGCTYDKTSNTLTLENFSGEDLSLDANLLGNGFKIKLIGDNKLGSITVWGAMYGGSVTFVGSGSLTVNENNEHPYGILLNAEDSRSCLMVDKNVTLKVSGAEGAVMIYDSYDEIGIYFITPQKLSGGLVTRMEGEDTGTVNTIMNGDSYSTLVTFSAG
ncbi:MAG: hypothetical protein J6112_03180 [Clostridia bacterium]|nr:hypothetical protein [Clostridia bacterium]